MSKPIRLALEQALAQILVHLLPATGQRRRRGRPRRVHAAPRTLSGLRLFVHRAAVPTVLSEALLAKARAARRAEACAPLGDAGPRVRPYLLAHERRQRQQVRRTALVLALDGIDIGPWVIHGHRVGTPAPLEVAA
ncbi:MULTISPECIES: hypothetical protein [unclassified Streptomyces]|uniref:hypothetical protein n=1 Tax=unclassified Streptomyces TaxID=2593676 RepID=UPI00073BD46C|nr:MULTISPECIES: hypothetical protein [unclassified Streptomyces]ODA73322.1 hypothetical protein APS67_002585 [Streptomyces sp. AVP053U2]